MACLPSLPHNPGCQVPEDGDFFFISLSPLPNSWLAEFL